ncbi:hepatocellular carcinoma-associated antigen 59-domain-containing protein [Mycena amicta]|nr:hepatocellular carcinoma-associated antigen 59-domain-containing protein [Mycena amicta]
MIKKRTRPQQRLREKSPEDAAATPDADEEEEQGPLVNDLIELRKLRKARQGIDAAKLTKGDTRRKKRPREEEVQAGLRPGFRDEDEDDHDEDDLDARARRAVRNSNFTQQTNALDVDKHMMAYIEANLTVRGKVRDEDTGSKGPADPQEALYTISDRWKVDKTKPTPDDGSVTNSITMLTAIPEVDLGMDSRLKNIEDTEKAKRDVAEGRQQQAQQQNKVNPEEAHLVASRFYRPGLKSKSDADILRDAKLEAMGLPVPEEQARRNDGGVQLATDELVMERFKKRMRK